VKQQTGEALAHGTTGLAISSGASSYFGWFIFINDNAPAIGVLLSGFFGFAGLIFYILTWRKSTLADQNKEDLEGINNKLDNHIIETREETKNTNKLLNIISNKLDKG